MYIDNSLTQKINVTIKRGQDFQLIAGIVFCCDMYPEQAMPSSQNLNTWLLREDHPPEQFKAAMRDVLNRFWHIVDDEDLNKAFTEIKQRVAPAEFIFTGERGVSHKQSEAVANVSLLSPSMQACYCTCSGTGQRRSRRRRSMTCAAASGTSTTTSAPAKTSSGICGR